MQLVFSEKVTRTISLPFLNSFYWRYQFRCNTTENQNDCIYKQSHFGTAVYQIREVSHGEITVSNMQQIKFQWPCSQPAKNTVQLFAGKCRKDETTAQAESKSNKKEWDSGKNFENVPAVNEKIANHFTEKSYRNNKCTPFTQLLMIAYLHADKTSAKKRWNTTNGNFQNAIIRSAE